MKQHKTTWQRHERHVAAAMGTTRTGNHPGADVITPGWAIECKSWRRLPARVLDALHQAERSATGERVAVAVFHEVNGRHDDDLVVMRWRDFQDLLLGDAGEDRRTVARVAAAVQMADATPEERAILAPDL